MILCPVFCGYILASSLAMGPATVSTLDPTVDSAVNLIKSCIQPRRTAAHTLMLSAMRHLRDPQLQPLFNHMADSNAPHLRIHGILGLAECSPKRRIDLTRLMESESPSVQRQLVSLAMDLELINTLQAKQLMGWPALDPAVRMVVCAFLLRHQIEPDVAFLQEMMQSDQIGLASFAALLLLQMDDSGGLEKLKTLDQLETRHRDRVRFGLLRRAFQSEFDRVLPWAMHLAAATDVDSGLARQALVVALRFGGTEAETVWHRRYQDAADRLEQIKLALVVLNASYWVSPDLLAPMVAGNDEMIRQIGETAFTVAARQPVADTILEALKLNNALVNDWALDYAKELATNKDACTILRGLILSFDGPPQRLAQRLQTAVNATSVLLERHPDAATSILPPILTDPETDNRLIRGILLGLLQAQAKPYPIIADLPQFEDAMAASLQLLITARYNDLLSSDQIRELSLMVRGGSRLTRHLRVQAAWTYLKRTGQSGQALTKILGS